MERWHESVSSNSLCNRCKEDELKFGKHLSKAGFSRILYCLHSGIMLITVTNKTLWSPIK